MPGGSLDGGWMRTASGQQVPTKTPIRITAEDNWGQSWKMKGKRMVQMHKPLVSAAVLAGSGWDQWLTAGGGWMYSKDSPVAKKISALLETEAQKPDAKMLPLFEEGGVYNFYLYMGAKSGMEEVNGVVPVAPSPSYKDALIRPSGGTHDTKTKTNTNSYGDDTAASGAAAKTPGSSPFHRQPARV